MGTRIPNLALLDRLKRTFPAHSEPLPRRYRSGAGYTNILVAPRGSFTLPFDSDVTGALGSSAASQRHDILRTDTYILKAMRLVVFAGSS